ncbi:MAG: hypothetical protein A4E19_00305 [Nitrospira sp. SG-bin1]|nr:MAG: hypothetical protein A4E19_00305 [Nitrospira sp. SG-bin1]
MTKKPSNPQTETSLTTTTKQYDLFTTFFGNPNNLSNTIELWDAIPKYAVNERAQSQVRDEKGNLPVSTQEFLYRPTVRGLPKEITCKLTIQPASIKNSDGTYTQYYPSNDEELLEEVLKKFFTDQNFGQHRANGSESWVRFTLGMVQQELKRRGKSRSLDEIKHSLEILSKAVLTVEFDSQQQLGVAKRLVYTNPILSEVTGVTRLHYLQDPKAMWLAKLPSLISKSVNELSYRQFNYGTLMSLSSQLARWFHKRLSHQYTQASITDPYHIKYSSIRRDSGLLRHSRQSVHVKQIDAALNELTDKSVLLSFKKDVRKRGNAITEIVYSMLPTSTFQEEIKTANARQSAHNVELGISRRHPSLISKLQGSFGTSRSEETS